MAKAKTKAKANSELSFDEYIKREYGADIIISGDNLVENPREIIPTALSLDVALNGGIPEGSIVLISGKPKAGKSSLCLQVLANAQKQKRSTFYFDIERRCKSSLLSTVKDLDVQKLQLVRSTTERILTAESWLQLLERVIKDHKRAVVVVDSIAALATECEMVEATGTNKEMGGVPKLLAQFLRKIAQVVDTNDVTLIFISQLMSGRNPKGAKVVEKGGYAIQYYASVWLNMNWVQQWQPDPDTQAPLGQDVHIRIISSALGAPFLPCALPLRFGYGFDITRDLVGMAENFGLVEKAGAWYSLPLFDNQKFHGIKEVCKALDENHVIRDKLELEIRSIVLPDVNKDARQQSDTMDTNGTPDKEPVKIEVSDKSGTTTT